MFDIRDRFSQSIVPGDVVHRPRHRTDRRFYLVVSIRESSVSDYYAVYMIAQCEHLVFYYAKKVLFSFEKIT